MKEIEKEFGLMNQSEVIKMSNFDISEEPVMDPTGVNWKTGVKAALAGGGMAAVFLPAVPAAAAAV